MQIKTHLGNTLCCIHFVMLLLNIMMQTTKQLYEIIATDLHMKCTPFTASCWHCLTRL